jgi:NodT family efflux transporter outer membrane factor (OMF) lipoprotein
MSENLSAHARAQSGSLYPHSRASAVPLRSALLALVCALAVAGCAEVGPNYRQPASTMPATFHNSAALAAHDAAASAPAPALDTWWNGFNDPELTRIVQRVLDQNLDLAAAMARIQQARAAANHAGAERLPEGNASASIAGQHQSLNSPLGKAGQTLPGYNRNQSLTDLGIGASWELDLFGGLKRGAEAADAQAQAAQADGDGVRISVAAEAADAYFRVRGAQQRIEIAQSQVDTDSHLLQLVTWRMNDGLATNRELAEVQALVAQSRATIPSLRIELETQLNRLDVLMGAQPGTYAAELRGPDDGWIVPAISMAQGPADLLRRRPDVIAAERRVAAANAQIGVATAEYYPKVSISALLGFESLSGGKLLGAASFQPEALAGLRWRLFDFGRVDAEVAQAKGANAEALANYRKAMLRATEDVENAMVTMTQTEMQSQELSTEVDAQRRARDASEDAYKGGAIGLYEVLDQDRQLLAAQDQLASARIDDARAAVSTFRALGGGW